MEQDQKGEPWPTTTTYHQRKTSSTTSETYTTTCTEQHARYGIRKADRTIETISTRSTTTARDQPGKMPARYCANQHACESNEPKSAEATHTGEEEIVTFSNAVAWIWRHQADYRRVERNTHNQHSDRRNHQSHNANNSNTNRKTATPTTTTDGPRYARSTAYPYPEGNKAPPSKKKATGAKEKDHHTR